MQQRSDSADARAEMGREWRADGGDAVIDLGRAGGAEGSAGAGAAQPDRATVGANAAPRTGVQDALASVLAEAEAAMDNGDMPRAKRLLGVAKELRALGMGGGRGD